MAYAPHRTGWEPRCVAWCVLPSLLSCPAVGASRSTDETSPRRRRVRARRRHTFAACGQCIIATPRRIHKSGGGGCAAERTRAGTTRSRPLYATTSGYSLHSAAKPRVEASAGDCDPSSAHDWQDEDVRAGSSPAPRGRRSNAVGHGFDVTSPLEVRPAVPDWANLPRFGPARDTPRNGRPRTATVTSEIGPVASARQPSP